MKMNMSRIRLAATLGCAMLAASTGAMSAYAQTTTGAVTGEVTDSSGAVIPNATVTVTNLDTGVSTPTQSNKDGVYTLRFLQIGRYKLTTDAPGFGEKATQPFTIEINQTIKIDTKLAVREATGTIVVTTEAPILDTTDGVISTTFTENEIQNLPLEGRNFQSVALYTPGVVNTQPVGMSGGDATERSTQSNNLISVNGNRGQANSYTLDGVDLNEGQNNQVSYNPAPDSLQEIKVISGNAPAIYGNVNGGDVVAVLKNGTNKYHGSAYGYLENWKLNANSWSNKYQGLPINHTTQSIFGATVGGPIRIPHLYDGRDRLFFFFDYEGTRQPGGGSKTITVLTPAMLAGDFSALPFQLYNTQAYNSVTNTFPIFVNNQVPVNNPVAKFLLANPADYPNTGTLLSPSQGSYLPRYEGTTRSYQNNNQFDAKVDWTPSTKDRISGFYAQSRADDGSTTIYPISFPGVNSYPTTLFGVSYVRTFSASIVNQFNAGFTRTNWNNNVPIDHFGSFGYNGDKEVGIPFGTQRYVGFSEQDLGNGANNIGNRAAPQLLIDNTFAFNDNFTMQLGHQLFTIGVQTDRYQENYTQGQNAGALGYFRYTGVYTKDPASSNPQFGPADFVFDAVSNGALQDGGEVGNRQWRAAGYIQDDWKLFRKLTLNLGVRYEWDQPMIEANNKNANVLPLNGGTMEFAGSVPTGAPAGSIVCPTRACYNPNYKQIMPRFGFAYQVASNISVRGGYGATSFFEGNAANQRLSNNPPLVTAFTINGAQPSITSGGSAQAASNGFTNTSQTLNGGSFSEWPQNIQPALVQQWNLTVETALDSVTSLSIGYVGQSGQHLMDYGNANQFTQAQAFDLNVNNPSPVPASDLSPYYNLGAGTPYAAGNGGAVLITESRAKSNYNGAQVTVRRRESHGLEYNLNYTFAKSMTNAAGNYGVPGSNAGDQTFQDYYNSQADYGPSGDDIRHQFNAVIVYAIPYGHGRQFGANANRFLDEALGGWSLTNAFKAFSGPPATILANGGNTGSYGSERANQYGRMVIVHRTINDWFGTDPSAIPCTDGSGVQTNGCAYGQPNTYSFGTASNGTERSPGFYQLDMSLFKNFRIFHEQNFGFRADFFNILNVADYGQPNGNIQSYNSNPQQNGFGQINSVENEERHIQLSLNYKF